MPGAIDLIGPKGYTHGWVYHGPGSGTRSRTSKLVGHDVARAKGSLANASPSLTANRATAALRGKRGSDYQHLAAARLHMAAARAADKNRSYDQRAYHHRMAAMHRGIAGRNVGRQTRSEGPLRLATELARHQPVDPKIKLGSGGRFAKLKSRLAARGARNPGALAAYIGRRAYGKKKFAALGAKGRAHSHANGGPAVDLSNRSLAITGPYDLVISRGENGEAIIRHRRGGAEIGTITRRGSDGAWVAAAGGKELGPHTRQRGALLELIGTHNRNAGTPYHRPAAPKPEKETSPLAQVLGLPDMDLDAAQLATPANDSDDGPRVTGLGTGGQKIYKRLRGRGFPHARAHAFASRAQRKMGGPK